MIFTLFYNFLCLLKNNQKYYFNSMKKGYYTPIGYLSQSARKQSIHHSGGICHDTDSCKNLSHHAVSHHSRCHDRRRVRISLLLFHRMPLRHLCHPVQSVDHDLVRRGSWWSDHGIDPRFRHHDLAENQKPLITKLTRK